MKRTLTILICAALSLTASGCKDAADFANKVEKELGIDVQLNAYPEDTCVELQLRQFLKDYKRLSRAGRADVKARIKAKYKGISIQGTQTTETYTGTATEWQYIYPGDKYMPAYVRDSRILEDKRIRQGTPPLATQARKDEILELTPQATHEDYTLVRFGTVSGILYDHVNSLEELREALDDYSSGVIGYVSTDSVNDFNCGPVIHLIDLL